MSAAARRVDDYRDREWRVQPNAEAFLQEFLTGALKACPPAATFADRLWTACGVRLRDIIDHIEYASPEIEPELAAAGWRRAESGQWIHEEGYFPDFLPASGKLTVWFRVEDAGRFVQATDPGLSIDGRAHAPLRRVMAFEANEARFGAIERSGHVGYETPQAADRAIRQARLHAQAFRARRREFDTVESGLDFTEALVTDAVNDIGSHWACALWLSAERDYWMRGCAAGRLQKSRQDAAGVGWSNIDHHTYDGSRRYFRHTIKILETLGYELREMLYAGELAGWGSQVLEQPALKSTIFADVDLAPEELTIDFAHEELPDLDKHRRAGVLCVIHGESILEAGLNHVAALYDQKLARALLASQGVSMMPPFSDFAHLYQELTIGDRRPVDPSRVDALEREGHLPASEAEDIRLNGAIATHLENIERNDGYKGFNKSGIDGVLRKLDPRAYGKNREILPG
ncbi:MAG: hypothetical protein AAGH48_05735 [Pseudomonadota bacterium]